MRIFVLCLLLNFCCIANSATLTWPGPAPCNTTLQSCINNVAAGDTVRVASGLVDETVFVTKSLRLEAAPGYAPRFTAGRNLNLNFNQPATINITVRGFTFEHGQIWAYQSEGAGIVTIERNRIEATDNGVSGISLRTVGGSDLTYRLNYNTIHYAYDGVPQPRGAIRVVQDSDTVNMAGEIIGNTVHALGNSGQGIATFSSGLGSHNVDIIANSVLGAAQRGIEVHNSGDSGAMNALIVSNLVTSGDLAPAFGEGISLWSFGGPIAASVINNTIFKTGRGLAVRVGGSGATSAEAANNLIAYNNDAWFVTSTATFSDDHNLFYGNNFPPDDADATSITADPHLRLDPAGRLGPSSPAIDAGDTDALITAAAGRPRIDGNGNRRFIGTDVDIGAFEFGDVSSLVRSPGTSTNNFAINSPALDGQPGLFPQITQNWNPYGAGGIYNSANEGLYYFSGGWRVFNQDTTAPIPHGAAFSIFSPGIGQETASHSATAANITDSHTLINWPAINSDTQRILAVSQHWNRDGAGVYNDHPIGVFHGSGGWRIVNLDLAPMPEGADFNLYAQDPSQNAYVHIAQGANIALNWTTLRHPLLDGNPCARLQVTQTNSQGVFNDHPVGLFYTGSHWAIFNEDGSSMPPNAAFHVVIDGTSGSGCQMFSDRFESL